MCTEQDLSNIAKEIREAALKMCPDIEKIILYGSYARGDHASDSDMDIMIVIDDTQENVKKYRRQFSAISAYVGMKYDVLLSVLFRDKANFEEKIRYVPFYQNIVNEGVEWYGRAA